MFIRLDESQIGICITVELFAFKCTCLSFFLNTRGHTHLNHTSARHQVHKYFLYNTKLTASINSVGRRKSTRVDARGKKS